jgi:hypothetical protein
VNKGNVSSSNTDSGLSSGLTPKQPTVMSSLTKSFQKMIFRNKSGEGSGGEEIPGQPSPYHLQGGSAMHASVDDHGKDQEVIQDL